MSLLKLVFAAFDAPAVQSSLSSENYITRHVSLALPFHVCAENYVSPQVSHALLFACMLSQNSVAHATRCPAGKLQHNRPITIIHPSQLPLLSLPPSSPQGDSSRPTPTSLQHAAALASPAPSPASAPSTATVSGPATPGHQRENPQGEALSAALAQQCSMGGHPGSQLELEAWERVVAGERRLCALNI